AQSQTFANKLVVIAMKAIISQVKPAEQKISRLDIVSPISAGCVGEGVPLRGTLSTFRSPSAMLHTSSERGCFPELEPGQRDAARKCSVRLNTMNTTTVIP
ncbi:unnamed protein product, partial [Ectocarpus sp. 12 AP-2014]